MIILADQLDDSFAGAHAPTPCAASAPTRAPSQPLAALRRPCTACIAFRNHNSPPCQPDASGFLPLRTVQVKRRYPQELKLFGNLICRQKFSVKVCSLPYPASVWPLPVPLACPHRITAHPHCSPACRRLRQPHRGLHRRPAGGGGDGGRARGRTCGQRAGMALAGLGSRDGRGKGGEGSRRAARLPTRRSCPVRVAGSTPLFE